MHVALGWIFGTLSLLLALMPPTLGASHRFDEGKGKAKNSPSPIIKLKSGEALHSLKQLMGSNAPKNPESPESGIRRHIRSVESQISQQSNEGFEPEELIQSPNSASEELSSDVVHKSEKSYPSSDLMTIIKQNGQNPQQLQESDREESRMSKSGGPKWFTPMSSGHGHGHFSRGVRPDRNFIRFGRSNFDGFSFSGVPSMSYNRGGNKKNNFIRLGRENPRRNNFIRLGRSGLWGNNERFGSKVGYFPDYYSPLSSGGGSLSTMWNYPKFPPFPYDPADVIQG